MAKASPSSVTTHPRRGDTEAHRVQFSGYVLIDRRGQQCLLRPDDDTRQCRATSSVQRGEDIVKNENRFAIAAVGIDIMSEHLIGRQPQCQC